MKRPGCLLTLLAAISLLLAAAVCSCIKQTPAKPTLAVSIAPQRWLLEQLVGSRYDIVTLLSPDANPETYDPQVSTLTGLQHSKIFFRVGTIGFEHAALAKISENFPDLKIADTSKGFALQKGTHPGPDGADPHIWTSVEGARNMARNMYDELVAMEPDQKDYYTKRYEALQKKLDALDRDIRSRLADSQGQAFVIKHPSLTYFADEYGVRQVALEPGGKEPSPRDLRRRQDEARQANASVFLIEKSHDSESARQMARQLSLPVAEISLLDYDWDKSMLQVADAIARH